MKISSVITFSLLFLFNSTIVSQWINVGTTPFSQIYNLDAIDSSFAIISGTNQGLYRTTNGGTSWELLNNPTQSSIIGISVIDNLNIWIAGASSIFKSADGCNTWIEQYHDTSKTDFFNYIQMFDLNQGVAMGDPKDSNQPALFLHTTDGGNNWISVNQSNFIGQSSADLWRRVDFFDANNGYFFPGPYLGGVYKNLYRTTDGGVTWNLTNYEGYAWLIRFFNQNIGITSPGGYKISRTLDAGQTWETFNTPNQNPASDIRFDPNDASRVWLSSNDLFFSSDTGKTWRIELSNAYGYAMSMVNSHIAWLSGNGITYRTTNAGDTFVPVETESNNSINNFELSQNYPNPFNPTTNIVFSIAEPSNIKIVVYNLVGEEVAVLLNEYKNSGQFEINFDGSGLSSGIYFYQLITPNSIASKKMILLR
jgi:photosystem II stability/assembly factor-like uncharacterized protein